MSSQVKHCSVAEVKHYAELLCKEVPESSPDKVVDSWFKCLIDIVLINDEYLFVYAVNQPWYATTTQLVELGIYRIKPGPTKFKDVVACMHSIALGEGCDKIVVGTMKPQNNAALARMYERQGFKISHYTLSKEV